MEFLTSTLHIYTRYAIASLSAALLLLSSCRTDDVVYPPEEEETGTSQDIDLTGFYLLNEGNMGTNKATLDRYTFADAIYSRNIYAEANPDVPKEMGDVGNDMRSYGSKLWVVVNCSNKVEILDLKTTRRIGQVDIPNCRYIAFDGPSAYVTSYAGPVEINPDYSQKGIVVRIDTLTMRETGRVKVGFQPDGIAIAGGKIYVANSGGYMVPNYEKKMTIIDEATMTVEREVDIAINLEHVVADSHGRIWISSRGDYFDNPSRLYVYDPAICKIVKTFDTPVSNFWLDGDRLYTTAWSRLFIGDEAARQFAVFDTEKMEKVVDNYITDGSEKNIQVPYAVAVNPVTKEIYISDATTYVNPGFLYCYSAEGVLKWKQRTGDVPKAIVFY